MKKLIKDWWPLLLIAGWWLWKKHGKKQIHAQIRTREEAIRFLKDNFTGVSGVVGWSRRDLDPNTPIGIPANDPNYSDFIPGLSINGREYVTAVYGDSLMEAFRVLFGNSAVKIAYYHPARDLPGGVLIHRVPCFGVIFTDNESATEARSFLNKLFTPLGEQGYSPEREKKFTYKGKDFFIPQTF